MGPVPQGGNGKGGKAPTPKEAPSPVGRSAWMEGELWSLGGEGSNWFVESKMESNLHRRLAPPPL